MDESSDDCRREFLDLERSGSTPTSARRGERSAHYSDEEDAPPSARSPARHAEEPTFRAQPAWKPGLRGVSSSSSSLEAQTTKFSRAKADLDLELAGFAREASALLEAVPRSAEDEQLSELAAHVASLCAACRACEADGFDALCRSTTLALEELRRKAEGRVGRSLVTRMLFALTRCTRLLPVLAEPLRADTETSDALLSAAAGLLGATRLAGDAESAALSSWARSRTEPRPTQRGRDPDFGSLTAERVLPSLRVRGARAERDGAAPHTPLSQSRRPTGARLRGAVERPAFSPMRSPLSSPCATPPRSVTPPRSPPRGSREAGQPNVITAVLDVFEKVAEWNTQAARQIGSNVQQISNNVAQAALRLSPLGGRPQDAHRTQEILCRICEERVDVSCMKRHSAACAAAEAADCRDTGCVSRVQALCAALRTVPPSERGAGCEALLRCGAAATRLGDAGEAIRLVTQIKALLADEPRGAQRCEHLHSFGVRVMSAVMERLSELQASDWASLGGSGCDSPASSSPSQRGGSPAPSRASSGMALSDYDVLKPISRGAFGKVLLARKRTTGDLYALKVLRKRDLVRKNLVQAALAERDALARGGATPFVVRLFYSFSTAQSLYLVMEYAPGGDVYSLLRALGRLSEAMCRTYAAEVVLALEYIHSCGIVHRDLKPDNLLISASGHLKLADFGLSLVGLADQANDELTGAPAQQPRGLASPVRGGAVSPLCLSPRVGEPFSLPRSFSAPQARCESPLGQPRIGRDASPELSPAGSPSSRSPQPPGSPAPRAAGGCVGTPDYLSPELLLGTGHGCEVDWWALGVLVFELLTGAPPFTGRSPQAVFDNILSRRLAWPPPPPGEPPFSEDAVSLVDALLQSDPAVRLGCGGAGEVRRHAFFASLDWEQLARQKHEAAFVPAPESETDTSYFVSRPRPRQGVRVAVDASGKDDAPSSPSPSPSPQSEDGDFAFDAGMSGVGSPSARRGEGEGGAGWSLQSANAFLAAFSWKNVTQLATWNVDLAHAFRVDHGQNSPGAEKRAELAPGTEKVLVPSPLASLAEGGRRVSAGGFGELSPE